MVRFRRVPNAYSDLATVPNQLRFRISPAVQFPLGMLVMVDDEKMTGGLKELAGVPTPVSNEKDAYERVLTDAIQGDATLFAPGLCRGSLADRRSLDLKSDSPVYPYEPQTWGPPEVEKNVAPNGGWHNPNVPF